MSNISTLTLSPTIDTAFEVETVCSAHEMNTLEQYYNPGGGGINVARVAVRLGANARCYYLSGGALGPALDGLLDLHQIVRERIAISGDTRMSTTIFERESGKEYRIVPPGTVIGPEEWQECLERIASTKCDYLVASGPLPPGVPEDFYARVAALVAPRGVRVILDSSGAGLSRGLDGGHVYLAKPSLAEFRELTGQELPDLPSITAAAMELVETGRAQYLAVTMGSEGALLARAAGPLFLPALKIETRSAIGAGDSFLAALIFALVNGRSEIEAFRFGMAAGAAALLNPGTNLSQAKDIARLLPLVEQVS